MSASADVPLLLLVIELQSPQTHDKKDKSDKSEALKVVIHRHLLEAP